MQRLTAALRSDRLAHAYLFAGPNGIGKRLVAMRWAMAINCDAPRPSSAPPAAPGEFGGCGACASCRRSLAGTHPDLLVVEPDGQFIKIEQVRDLQAALTLTAWSGPRKIALIDRAERLNQEAANALLKTLEEPPPASLLILISAVPDDLLPTIRSRCQTVRFFPLGQPQLAQWLATERQWTAGDATLTSAIAGGCLGLALANEPALLRDERDQIERWLAESCLNPADPARAADRLIEGAESAAQTPERFERTLHWLRLWLQDTVRAAAVPGGAAPVRFPSAHRAAELVPLSACSELAAQLHWTWRASFRNINRQLLLEHWLIALRDAVIDARRPRPTRERVAR
jgi:DNA polymerase-3 subunit delta'